MKKFLSVICFSAIALAGKAQQANAAALPDNAKWMRINNGYPNNVNTRAVRDFVRRTKPAPDAEWVTITNGFVVKYVVDNRHCRTVYNRRGNFLYTVRQYSEGQMPKEVRRIVKSRYFDHSITLVEEVERQAGPLTYVVHLEDATTLINVHVKEGQIDRIEDYIKG